jgi:hypothetical protein
LLLLYYEFNKISRENWISGFMVKSNFLKEVKIKMTKIFKGLPDNAAEAQALLKQMLAYCPAIGEFTRLVGVRGGGKAGSKAGSLRLDGYTQVMINGKLYRAHRLAWLYEHGAWPVDIIDHVDQDRSNDRISNLRECSQSENQRNVGLRVDSNSGFKGVSWHKASGKFRAHASVNGKLKHLGYFLTSESANAARIAHEISQDCEFYASARN